MKRQIFWTALLLIVALPAPSPATPDRTFELNATESAVWQGDTTTGLNPTYWSVDQVPGMETCSRSVDAYCEVIHLTMRNPADDSPSGSLSRKATVTVDPAYPFSDYDIQVWVSDQNGARVQRETLAATLAVESSTETVEWTVRTTSTISTRYYLVEIVYYAATGGYTGTVRF